MKHKHAELMVQYAQDAMEAEEPWKRWEYKPCDSCVWLQAMENSMWDRYTEYRRKPQTKVVDMSVLIESGIDCEFKDEGSKWYVSQLTSMIYEGSLYQDEYDIFWEHCRPRMNHIHAWQGGECPLPKGVLVNVYYRDGDEWLNAGATSFKKWSHNGYPNDIIAFEVVGLVDGYCWPWECE